MAEPLVIDTGALISLAQAGALHLLPSLSCQFVCPPQVQSELDAGEARGHPVVRLPALSVRPLSSPLRHIVEGLELGPGEAGVIQLALEEGIARVCLDDSKARRAALAAGLQVTGSLGLLLRAKALDLVPAIRPLIENARAAGTWYDAQLVSQVLEAAGET